MTESKASAMCCNRLEVDGERREGGKVTTATAFEGRSMPLRDLTKERMSHSCNASTMFNLTNELNNACSIKLQKLKGLES